MKWLKRGLITLAVILALFLIYFRLNFIPIITGYGAKNLCTCHYVGGRSVDDILREELSFSFIPLGTFTLNQSDSSASGTVLGMGLTTAYYRKGLGCTIVKYGDVADWRSRVQPPVQRAPVSRDSIPWPYGDSITRTYLTANVEDVQISRALDYAFADTDPHQRRTRAVIIVFNGELIAERYAPGFDRYSMHRGWSMAKTVTNALTGILVKQGKLDINEPAPVDEWRSDERAGITLSHLLQQSSGLEWNETYLFPSGVNKMLHLEPDMGAYAASMRLEHAPGTFFYYSSGTSNIVSRILRKTIGDEVYINFPRRELFDKIGMQSMLLEADASGTFVGSSYALATARDWARFGMFLENGVWNGEQILPEDWIRYSTTPAPASTDGDYGAHIWLNYGIGEDRPWPDVPRDAFWADGFEGQSVVVIPSKALVVVRLAQEHGNFLDMNAFLRQIFGALPM
jgi:CubicO group peptidase (beta-lactamase class C family)